MNDLEIEVRQRSRTLAKWLGKSEHNPEFARKWLRGQSAPRKAHIKEISARLGVREEWLEYGVEPKELPSPDDFGALSSQEQAFISEFRKLSTDDRKKIYTAVQVFSVGSD